MTKKLNRNQRAFVQASEEKFGVNAVLSREDIQLLVKEKELPMPYWLITKNEYRSGRGRYQVPTSGLAKVVSPVVEQPATVDMAQSAQVITLRQPKLADDSEPSIPTKYPDYVPFGFFNDLKSIVASRQFFPVFITGHAGGGKTLMSEQVCAVLHRECIRVNISIETDESDLLGGPTLINGNVVNRDGPVLTAMKRGAVLLIDEVDRGSNKILCLQGILEGKPYYNKKTGEMVHPAPGFTVIATANTKGQGSDEGKYLAQILDSAFLSRFIVTIEQEFADIKIEKKILSALIDDTEFVDALTQWSDVLRKSFKSGAVDEVISTRGLVHIAKTYGIFKDKMKSINLCLNMFDENTKTAFIDLYAKIAIPVDANTKSEVVSSEQGAEDTVAF